MRGVLNHQPHDCLLNRFFRRGSKKTSKLRVTGLCAGNSPVTVEFHAQMASNAENGSIWWRHHVERINSSPLQSIRYSLCVSLYLTPLIHSFPLSLHMYIYSISRMKTFTIWFQFHQGSYQQIVGVSWSNILAPNGRQDVNWTNNATVNCRIYIYMSSSVNVLTL